VHQNKKKSEAGKKKEQTEYRFVGFFFHTATPSPTAKSAIRFFLFPFQSKEESQREKKNNTNECKERKASKTNKTKVGHFLDVVCNGKETLFREGRAGKAKRSWGW